MRAQRFDYSNLPARPTGRGVQALARISSGVRSTLAEVEPYAYAWERHNALAVAADGPLWVVLGDSMAQGIGASRFDRGWPGQLAERIDPGYRMVNLSHHGARVQDVFDRQWPAALTLGNIDLVTVVIGSNDVVWRRYRAGLPSAFGRLVRLLPRGAVVANLPNPHREARAVDRLLRTDGAARGLRLADMRGPRTTHWRGKLAADHFHPNDRGYAAMADVVADAVEGRP